MEYYQRMLAQMPGVCACKDLKSVFLYGNLDFSRIIGLKRPEDAIGRTDFDMPCETVKCAHLFQEQDQKVIKTRKPLKILDIHRFADGVWRAYIFTKVPFYDPVSNLLIGTIFQGQDISRICNLDIAGLLSQYQTPEVESKLASQVSYTLGFPSFDKELSKRQKQVLFYTVRRKTTKQIAAFLSIKPCTVTDRVNDLKHIFNAKNKQELIDKAIDAGALNFIPEELLRKQLSLELRD